MPVYDPNLNFVGSSGYDVNGNPLTTGPRYPSPSTRADYGVQMPDGTVVSVLTGKPWSGKEPRTGQMYQGGKLMTGAPGTVQVPGTQTFINPNDPTQRYKPVSVTKQPDVAQGQQDLMKSFTDSASSALKDFSSYLSTFKDASKTAFGKTAAATDVAPTINNLRTLQSSYAGSLGRNAADYATLNAQNADAERGIVSQAQATLPQYDLAAQAIGDRQLAALMAQNARYKMGSGTPTSLGGADSAILARAVADVNLPLQEQKIARQYDLLQNLSLPVQRDIANRETVRIGQFNPAQVAAIFQSGQGTEQLVQQLKNAAAGMSWQNATQWMTSLGVPAAVQQQILSGQIGQLGQLSNIESLAHYQGLQDVLGVYPSQPTGFSYGGPEYPGVPNRYPRFPATGGTGTLPTGGGGAAPIQVQPVTAAGTPVYPSIGTGTQGPPPPGAYGLNAYGVPQYPGYQPASYSGYAAGASGAGGVPLDYADWINSRPAPYQGTSYTPGGYIGDANVPQETLG